MVRVAYLAAAPLWKATYRLVLPDEEAKTARLQGWRCWKKPNPSTIPQPPKIWPVISPPSSSPHFLDTPMRTRRAFRYLWPPYRALSDDWSVLSLNGSN
jgi:hypothetical protein